MNKVVAIFDIIHCDIWGPIATKSIRGYSYFLTIVDDYSKFTWIVLMKLKSEARQKLIDFICMIETQHNSKVKIVRCDNGVEFTIPQLYSSKGIIHKTTCVESPEQNGRVERKHQDILNVGIALLFQANLPKSFLSFVVQHATYLINRLPTNVLNNKSPYELMHNDIPSLEHLKVFSSLAYASTLQSHTTKLEPRSRKCIFL
jgi:IS30 family transposase